MIFSLDPLHLMLFLSMLFLAAFLYASVGHGGASGYLAVLVLFSFEPEFMRSSALVLNIIVSFLSFYQYYRHGHFKWKLFYPFAITSVPAAFIGASVLIDIQLYKKLLGLLLIFPIVRLLGAGNNIARETVPLPTLYGLITGALIGFISGLTGIGGGIILSPVILLFHWANMKQTAAISALFIFVNSISALSGLMIKGIRIPDGIEYLILVVIPGGLLGAWLGSSRFSNTYLKYILATVLIIASLKLLLS